MNNLLDMGGYGVFVWSAFVISLIVLTSVVILTKRNLAATRAHLARRIEEEQRA